MKLFYRYAVVAALLLPLALAACEDEAGPIEEAGEETGEALEDTGEAVEEGAEGVSEEVEERDD